MTEKLRELIPGSCSTCPSRPPSAGASSPARRSRPSARTCWPSATAATSPASASCSSSQKEGKKRMKTIGRVEVPQEAFISALRLDELTPTRLWAEHSDRRSSRRTHSTARPLGRPLAARCSTNANRPSSEPSWRSTSTRRSRWVEPRGHARRRRRVVRHRAQRDGRPRGRGLPAPAPHVAGRVPTEKGYRFFVDHLRQPPAGAGRPSRCATSSPGPTARPSRCSSETSRLLSNLTNLASVVVAPPAGRRHVRSVQLVTLGPTAALLVVGAQRRHGREAHDRGARGHGDERVAAATAT